MATLTFSELTPVGVWTLVAAGATYATVGLQVAGRGQLHVFVGASEPAVGDGGWMTVNEGAPLVELSLTTGDSMWVMPGAPPAVAVSGYLVGV